MVAVADDDLGVRTTVAEILRADGYEVLEAEDGLVALAVLREHDVAVLILDIRMPHLDGIGVLDALEAPPAVLVVSAFTVDVATRARIGAKVFRFLRKPVAPLVLLQAVAEAAQRSAGPPT
ncbi:MAG TPA: response regulator [Acidimicrobiales bacterium]|nr:response regulator [Acidimicrobiales bacterium]